MASGLAALLDDVAAIAKIAAASVDDISAAAGRAATKTAGIVIDDAAVTPRYVVGFSPERELPIIGKITLGSLRNKLLILLPAALLLSYFAPWTITPILMLGGAFLCFEGAEKLIEAFVHPKDQQPEALTANLSSNSAEREKTMVSGAIRTDLILSAEIMALTLAQVPEQGLIGQAVVLAVVGIGVTVAVYGTVALIVKMDDIGLAMTRTDNGLSQRIGHTLVRGMPLLLSFLSVVGTAAMLWVGGGILVHGIAHFGWHKLPDAIHHGAEWVAAAVPAGLSGFAGWLAEATCFGVIGLMVGALIAVVVSRFHGEH